MSNTPIKVSIIVPVYNEVDSVNNLHQEIKQVCSRLGYGFEIVFVDDGSTDGTLESLKKLSPVIIVPLRRNYGQSCALDAGIKTSTGELIITLDGDGQNDPADIPALLNKIQEGYDVVCGWRHKRQDPFLKKFISKGAAFLRKFFVNDGIHDAGCTLRVYRRACFEDLNLYGELHRMIPALLKWRGFNITEIETNHRPRMVGKTKYNWRRTINGFLDMIYVWFWRKYSSRPLHLFGSVGIVLFALGSSILFLMAILRLFYDYPLSQKIWPLVGFFMTLTGIQLLTMGILAANLVENSNIKKYSVREIIKKD